MAKTLEFFFDVGSPASYIAFKQLPALAAAAGAGIHWRPMLLGGVFKATGNASPVTVPAKGRWMMGDLQRWAQRAGVPFRHNPFFPINTLTLMRGAAGLQLREPARLLPYCGAVFDAIWQQGLNLGDPAVVAQVLQAAGFDPEAFVVLVADAEVKAALIATTDEAVARGVFGAPTCFVGERMHFGQDRLDFVRDDLTQP
ncbi:MAG: 2-hydroxychromene-2-carboxylate isomerase [Rubrivivax sp.]